MHTSPPTIRFYQVTVEGKIDPSWSEWFAGMRTVTSKEPGGLLLTTLTGPLKDQSALHGLLDRLWDLNLVLRSVQQIDDDKV